MARENAIIRIEVEGDEDLRKVTTRLAELESIIAQINRTRLAIDDGRAEQGFKYQAKQLKEIVDKQVRVENLSQNTVVSLKEQESLWKRIANNANSTGQDVNLFTKSVVSATRASQKLAISEQNRLRALRDYAQGSADLNPDKFVSKNTSAAIDNLAKLQATAFGTNSLASLRAYKTELESVLEVISGKSGQRPQLLQDLKEVEQRIESIRSADAKVTNVRPGSNLSAQQKLRDENTALELNKKFYRIQTDIAQADISEVDRSKLKNDLAEARNALEQKNLDLAKRLAVESDRGIRSARIRKREAARVSQEQRVFGILGVDFFPTSGKMSGGQDPIPGSPTAKKQASGLMAGAFNLAQKAYARMAKANASTDGNDLAAFAELNEKRAKAAEDLLKDLKESDKRFLQETKLKNIGERTRKAIAEANNTVFTQIKQIETIISAADIAAQKGANTGATKQRAEEFLSNVRDIQQRGTVNPETVTRIGKGIKYYRAETTAEIRKAQSIGTYGSASPIREQQKALETVRRLLSELKVLANDYTLEIKNGADALGKQQDLLDDIFAVERSIALNKVNKAGAEDLGQRLSGYRSSLKLAVSDAQMAGTYTGGGKTAEQKVEDQRSRLLRNATSLQTTLLSLEKRGIDIGEAKADIEKEILGLKNAQNKSTRQENERSAQAIIDLKQKAKLLTPEGEDERGFLEKRFGRRGSAAISEGLIGGAFPLLFGQGLPASIGGGLGGAIGGAAGGGLGFGLSLIGTFVGQAFTDISVAATSTAKALEDPAKSFEELKTASMFSSSQVEKTIEKLNELGYTVQATKKAEEDILSRVGGVQLRQLAMLANESDLFARSMADLNTQFQAFIAGPLAAFLRVMKNAIDPVNVSAARLGFNPEQLKKFDAKLAEAAKKGGGFNLLDLYLPNSAGGQTNLSAALRSGLVPEIVAEINKMNPLPSAVTPGQALDQKANGINQELDVLKKKEESLNILEGFKRQQREAAREQQDLDKQRLDIIKSREEAIGKIRESIEEKIKSLRLETIAIENRAIETREGTRLSQVQSQNRIRVSRAGEGVPVIAGIDRKAVADLRKELEQISVSFEEAQLSAEQKAAKVKRDAALDVIRFDAESAKFKAGIEKEIARLNIETAKKVADINMKVARKREEYDSKRFELEKAIALLNLKSLEVGFRKVAIDAVVANNPAVAQYAQESAESIIPSLPEYKKAYPQGGALGVVEKIQEPPMIQPIKGVGNVSASTKGLDTASSKYTDAARNLVQSQLDSIEQEFSNNALEGISRFKELVNSQAAVADDALQNALDIELAYREMAQYLGTGMTKEVAEAIMEIEKLNRAGEASFMAIQQKIGAMQIAFAESLNDKTMFLPKNQEILKGYEDLLTELEEKFKKFKKSLKIVDGKPADPSGTAAGILKPLLPGALIQDQLNSSRTERNRLVSKSGQIISAGQAISGGFAEPFKGLFRSTAQETADLIELRSQMKGVREEIEELSKSKNMTEADASRLRSLNAELEAMKMQSTELERQTSLLGKLQGAFAGFFQNVADSFIDMAAQIIAQQLMIIAVNNLSKLFNIPLPGVPGGAPGVPAPAPSAPIPVPAPGGAIELPVIKKFASGGIVNSPTLFKFANGGAIETGMAGEAGPEGILPLTRGANGKLGVSAYGGDGGDQVMVSVSVDARGTKVEGQPAEARELGRLIGEAVRGELVKQKRNGGIL